MWLPRGSSLTFNFDFPVLENNIVLLMLLPIDKANEESKTAL